VSATNVIARLRELRAKATAGPWVTVGWNDATSIEGADVFVCGRLALLDGGKHKKDAAAIVAAMNSLDALLECAEALAIADLLIHELADERTPANVEMTPAEDALVAFRRHTSAALQALAGGGE